jgi:hypothetical protein
MSLNRGFHRAFMGQLWGYYEALIVLKRGLMEV